MGRLQQLAAAGLAFPLLATVLAQPPEIQHFAPHAVIPGATVILTFSGARVSQAGGLWTSFPAESRRVPHDNPDLVAFEVTAPPDLKPGVQFLQIASTSGVSNFQFILVDPLPTSGHTDRHQRLDRAAPLPVPGGVDSILKPEKVDYYSIAAQAGQIIPIEVAAHRFGSQMDPFVRVLDSEGRELAWNDDGPGGTRDSQFTFTAPLDGAYILAVHDVGYAGGPAYDYRLRVGVDFLPAFPFDSVASGALPVEQGRASIENLPALFTAALSGRDAHQIEFEAAENQRLVFATRTRSVGSACDLLLRIRKADGSKLAESDPASSEDATLTHAFKEAGRYTLELRELTGLPGSCAYELRVHEFTPGFELSAEQNQLQLAPGGAATLKVTSSRRDYKGPIQLQLDPLPEGWQIEAGVIEGDKNETELKITAPAGAPAGSIFHFRVIGRIPESSFQAAASTRPALRRAFPLMLHFPPALDGLIAAGIRAPRE